MQAFHDQISLGEGKAIAVWMRSIAFDEDELKDLQEIYLSLSFASNTRY